MASAEAPPLYVPGRRTLADRPTGRILLACLLALAANAVLIQTIVAEDSPLKNVVRAGILAAAGVVIALRRTLVPPWVVFGICQAGALLILRGNSDQLSIVFVLALIPALWSIDERRVLGYAALGSVAAFALVFAFLGLGVTHNEVLEFRERATFGTRGVPFFFNVVYGAGTLVVLYAFKYRLPFRKVTAAVVVAVATYLFAATDARGGYAALLLLLLLMGAAPALSRSGLFRLLVATVPGWMLVAAFFVASFVDDPSVNAALSHRPEHYNLFLKGIGLDDVVFSTTVKRFEFAVSDITSLDNSYLHLLVGGGLVAFVAFAILWARATSRLFAAGRHREVAFLLVTALYCASESILLRVENLFVIYAWFLVLRYGGGPKVGPPPQDSDRGLDGERAEDAVAVPHQPRA